MENSNIIDRDIIAQQKIIAKQSAEITRLQHLIQALASNALPNLFVEAPQNKYSTQPLDDTAYAIAINADNTKPTQKLPDAEFQNMYAVLNMFKQAQSTATPNTTVNVPIDDQTIATISNVVLPWLIDIKLNIKQIPTDRNHTINQTIENISIATANIEHLISTMLTKTQILAQSNLKQKHFKPCSIKLAINEALLAYPLTTNERKLIEWHPNTLNDFNYTGDNALTTHIVFNLLSNALNIIKNSGTGKIYLHLESDQDFNHFIFVDTSIGISKSKLETIFIQANKETQTSMGLGLPFCKCVMQSYNGQIVCHSEPNKYTEFVLSFPKITI